MVEPFEWPVRERLAAPELFAPSDSSFLEVLEGRRSERVLRPASMVRVVNALALGLHPRFWKEDDSFGRNRGPAISAGALHPISALIIPSREDSRLFRYNAPEHVLELLDANSSAVIGWCRKAREVLPDADGSFMLLIADSEIPEAVYLNAISLIWRDAGAILQLMAMICKASSLGFCSLGLLGGEIAQTLDSGNRLLPVGSAVIGEL